MTNLNDVKEQVKDRADLATYVARDTKLLKSGQGFKACCPLPGHQEKTPSFHIDARKNFFYCYGCRRGGDIFKYLEITRGMPFMEALKELAEEYRIQLPKFSPEQKGVSDFREQSFVLMDRACKYFEENLHKGTSTGAVAAREYLASRGYSLEDAKKYRLGWAPESGRNLSAKLREQKMEKLGEELGLLAKGKAGQDFFKARLMIPVEDHRGRIVAFSGRSLGLSENEGPKYKNSPETIIFKKKEVLYGLGRAMRMMREHGFVCVVEGFFDAWAFEKFNVPAVAVMGVALGPEHLDRLSKICREVVLVMDTDRAGVESTKRSLPLLYEHSFEVKVFSDLNGKDPDEWLSQFYKNKGSSELENSEILKGLQKSLEGMEWWARTIVDECKDKGLNSLQIVHRLEELWLLLKSPAHKRLWIKSLSPILNLTETQLATHFSEVRATQSPVSKAESKLDQMEALVTQKPRAVNATQIDTYFEDLAVLLLRHGSIWKDMKSWAEYSKIQDTFLGSPYKDAFLKAISGAAFDVVLFQQELEASGNGALIARSTMEADLEGDITSFRDYKKLLKELCLQILSVEKQGFIRRLTLDLKISSNDDKTAQILQKIQDLRKEIEELKKFSF